MGNLFSSIIVDKNGSASSNAEEQILRHLRAQESCVCIEDFKTLPRILEDGAGLYFPNWAGHDRHVNFRSGRIVELVLYDIKLLLEVANRRRSSPDGELSGEIGKLDALRRLTLEGLRSLPSDWSKLKSLKELRVCRYNGNINIDLAIFSTIDSLERLDIVNRHQSKKIKNLKALSKLKNLKTLRLWNCDMEEDMVSNFSSLKHLELYNCQSINSIEDLPSLQKFKTSCCHSIKRIANAPSLQEIEWNGCKQIICDISSCSQTLKRITLWACEVQLTSLICPNVTHFEFLGAHLPAIKNAALPSIKWATKYLPSLEWLRVDDWDKEHTSCLVKALSSSRFDKLRHLDLGQCTRIPKAEEDLASFFFTCLKRFPCLEKFSTFDFNHHAMSEIEHHLRDDEEYTKLAWNAKIRSFGYFDKYYDDREYDYDYIARAFPSLESLLDLDDYLSDQSCNSLRLNQAGRAFVQGRKGVAPRMLSKATWPVLLAKAGRRSYRCTNETKQATGDDREKHQKTLQSSAVYYLLRNGPILLNDTDEGGNDRSSMRKRTSSTIDSPSSTRPKLPAT